MINNNNNDRLDNEASASTVESPVLPDADWIRSAWASGVKWASNLRKDVRFIGVDPEAKYRYDDRLLRAVFTAGAYTVLDNLQITTDEEHAIVSVISK